MAEKYFYATTAPLSQMALAGNKVQRVYAILPKTPLRMEVVFREDPDAIGNEPSHELRLSPGVTTGDAHTLANLLIHEGKMLPNEAYGLVEQFILAGAKVRFYVHKRP